MQAKSDATVNYVSGAVTNGMVATMKQALLEIPYVLRDAQEDCKFLIGRMRRAHGGGWSCNGYLDNKPYKSWAKPAYAYMRGNTDDFDFELYLTVPMDRLPSPLATTTVAPTPAPELEALASATV